MPKKKAKKKTKKKTSQLTARQEKFINEFLLCLNAAEAARRAGYSEKSAKLQGHRLITNDNLLEKLRPKLKKALADDYDILVNQTIAELKNNAFSDIGEIHDRDLSEIDSRAIQAITETITRHGSTRKLKLHDKNAALITLCKYLGLIKENKVEIPDNVNVTFTIERK
jgi:phage terminase small subunit